MLPNNLFCMGCFAQMQEGKEYLQLIGNNIKRIRKEKGISQQQLADDTNIAKSTVQRIEKGTLNPTILMLKNISEVLEIDLKSLI